VSFPYHTIPDGDAFLSHHLVWALLLALIPLAVVWDNHPRREPWLAVSAVVLALVSFLFVWRTHHFVGAALAVVATVAAVIVLAGLLVASVVSENPLWPPLPLVVALVLSLIALDDVLQHAFGWGTPLDWVWNAHLRPGLPSH
jgi:hypothetical protein